MLKWPAGVVVGGYDVVGEQVFLGINAALRNRIKIGDGAFLGMGPWQQNLLKKIWSLRAIRPKCFVQLRRRLSENDDNHKSIIE